MNIHDLMRDLHETNASKIVLLVADGLGGLPLKPGGKTELETAHTPHLDALAQEGICGASIPVLPGITPGSGPGHLGLFGYDPLLHQIGRGILEALGINFDVGPKDVAVRGNFCSVDEAGNITDRRAGRPTTERCIEMCDILKKIEIPGVEVFVEPVREHRFVVVFRGDNLGDKVNDTDPQATGVPPLPAQGEGEDSARTAKFVNQFIGEAGKALKNQSPTNMITLRGFARYPKIQTMHQVYGLKAAALAVYPMYKGLAKLVGMDILNAGQTLEELIGTLDKVWKDHDFFFIHFKYTDSSGEDGDFDRKVKMIENLDKQLPNILKMKPDVLIVTGDHSTPSKMRSHSWHPVPTLLWAPTTCRPDHISVFGESTCYQGGLGIFQAMYLMPLAMAHAQRLGKYGA